MSLALSTHLLLLLMMMENRELFESLKRNAWKGVCLTDDANNYHSS
jgi:hypothetical protein